MDGAPVLEEGEFYTVRDGGDHIILEDRTKRGLESRGRSRDGARGVEADKGVIHDMDGVGHEVPIRWYYPRGRFCLDDVMARAGAMERRYREMRDLTCPGGD